MSFIRVSVAQVRGSAPREVGAAMLVYAGRIEGTIGGGALEWQAMAEAREMLAAGRARAERSYALGPALGQCCGGAVTLVFEAGAPREAPAPAPLWIWGAGHVGRALVDVFAPIERLALTWVDIAPERFPAQGASGAQQIVAAEPALLMPRAPETAHHLIVTYSHELDLALCHAALRRGFASAGLIGSQTKKARFWSRLRALGHEDAQIARITCPIGDPKLGKEPQAIAIGVAARLLSQR